MRKCVKKLCFFLQRKTTKKGCTIWEEMEIKWGNGWKKTIHNLDDFWNVDDSVQIIMRQYNCSVNNVHTHKTRDRLPNTLQIPMYT